MEMRSLFVCVWRKWKEKKRLGFLACFSDRRLPQSRARAHAQRVLFPDRAPGALAWPPGSLSVFVKYVTAQPSASTLSRARRCSPVALRRVFVADRDVARTRQRPCRSKLSRTPAAFPLARLQTGLHHDETRGPQLPC